MLLTSGISVAAAQDLKTLESDIQHLSTAVEQQLTATDPLLRYHAYKAKMWLTYAKNEASERSLTVAGQEAVQHAQDLVQGFDDYQSLPLTTPVLSVSQAMRRDIWAQIEYFKQQGAIALEPERLAQAEVHLVWAAAEYCELGWRHAREHFWAVERNMLQVQQTANYQAIDFNTLSLPTLAQLNGDGCQGVNTQFWPLTMKPAKAAEIEQPVELMIENVVHFALDRAELNAEGKAVLDQIIALLKNEADLNITLVGHTDFRASVDYNIRLSQRRIQTVKNYLVGHGIDAVRIAEQAKGESDLISDTEQRLGHAKSRRVVIEFHDIEGKAIRVQPQWRDLQLEPVKQ